MSHGRGELDSFEGSCAGTVNNGNAQTRTKGEGVCDVSSQPAFVVVVCSKAGLQEADPGCAEAVAKESGHLPRR